ncbi:hypothetical protein TNIN_490181 [Trichonephila inaurata madagascariensis]|uniref:Uncharacterized protein n=1 Tax=Trichonephila inaurata madagascariensis TaxID=2747483 RepID=A0A8X6MEJ0_9ARAC|nr:hypothetical protein TNIN_490181 [Trichonephila inaurata madagascariensis]
MATLNFETLLWGIFSILPEEGPSAPSPPFCPSGDALSAVFFQLGHKRETQCVGNPEDDKLWPFGTIVLLNSEQRLQGLIDPGGSSQKGSLNPQPLQMSTLHLSGTTPWAKPLSIPGVPVKALSDGDW